jgi:bifunctional non-homologous end joining protein LigD
MPKGAAGKLEAYRRKRAAGATPEPFGGEETARPGLFVVQKHSARRLHFDLRLEIGGVLRSWAVPKGPSLDPQEKRLAVATEDHPLEYGDFEGVIPPGNYGAGGVIVWDRGPTVHHLPPDEALEDGKLLFELKGHKLRGLWTLVRTKRDPKEWLLIKKPDAAATGEDAAQLPAGSVLSGLTVEEVEEGQDRAAELAAELARLGAPRRAVDPAGVEPMLAQLRSEPFSGKQWLFELKYDGYRLLAAKEPAAPGERHPRATLRYRSGLDATAVYPELVLALRSLPYARLLLDGEVVVLDEGARPSFALLQQRARLSRHLDIERAAARTPATLYVFDLLACEGFDLRPLPLDERKRLLRRVLPEAGSLRFADHVEERGEDLYAEVRRHGLEGVVGKRRDRPYRAGRSADWIKVRADLTGEFAVLGYTRPQGSRAGFGGLHLGAFAGGRLAYVGRVGSGFTDRQLEELRARLDAFRRPDPPFDDGLPRGKEHVWVDPQLVVEVRYTELTPDGQLRHPVFLRLREDRRPEDCLLPGEPPAVEEGALLPDGGSPPERPMTRITRPAKVLWPAEGYTKSDLIHYYRTVSPWLLPYLKDRPLVLDRYPDGIDGKSFFQKNAPDFAPDWVRTEAVWSEETDKETRYFVCDDEEMLVYLANSAAIPLHVWASRVPSIQAPDWAILDLDAKDAEFRDVIRVARSLYELALEVELPCFVKTSGASGLHLLIPLAGQCTHEQARQLASLFARWVARQHPEMASVARSPSQRRGKVYVDALQNGYGKLLVAPYSVRPRPGAPVSAPLAWREVSARLDPRRFTIETMPKRLRRLAEDPLLPVLTLVPDLPGALERLAGRLE